MGETTKIEWCDHTFNAWIGCHKISPACKNCYAAVETFPRVQRGRGLELWGANAARHVTSAANWRKPLAWNKAAAEAGVRRRVFCSSMSDVFEYREGDVGKHLDDARAKLWQLIAATPHLDWLLLTKRPENVMRMVPEHWRRRFPGNVWLGCTAEDQKHADERIHMLLQCPAAVHFVSMEPLLGDVDIRRYIRLAPQIACTCAADNHPRDMRCNRTWTRCNAGLRRIDWVIVGGESGHGVRECHVDWIRSIAAQCKAAGVACLVKQLGANIRVSDSEPLGDVESGWSQFARPCVSDDFLIRLTHPKGGDESEWPHDLRGRREFPGVPHV